MPALRFGGYQPARSVHTRALEALQTAVARRSGGALTVDLAPNITTQGHKASDLLMMVEAGTLDGCYFASSYLAGRVPALEVFDLPFHAGAREAVFPALDGAAGARLAAELERRTGFGVLGYWDNGLRQISNAVRPIRRPGDCSGLRLRTLDNALHQASFRALGFDPVFIDVSALPQAVADGAVQAQENPLTNLINFGLHTSHRFVSLTGHLLGVALLLVNRARLDAMPNELRCVLRDAAAESTEAQRRFAATEDDACLALLQAAGIAPVPSTEIDLPAFRKAVSGVVERPLGELDPALRAALLNMEN